MMNRNDRDLEESLIKRKGITSAEIDMIFSLIMAAVQDEQTAYPIIKSFVAYRQYKLMKENDCPMSKSTVYRTLESLEQKGLIQLLPVINELGEESMDLIVLLNDSGHIESDEFFKSKGYIKMHHCFFQKVFYKLSLRAKKLAMIFFYRLNNDPSAKGKINFKSKKNPNVFIEFCKTLGVNRLAHIKQTIEELRVLFSISELDHNTFVFSLKEISKSIVKGRDKLYRFTKKQLDNTKLMIQRGNIRNWTFKNRHIEEICEAVCGYNMSFAQKIVNEVCLSDRRDVKHMISYVKSIIRRVSCSRVTSFHPL